MAVPARLISGSGAAVAPGLGGARSGSASAGRRRSRRERRRARRTARRRPAPCPVRRCLACRSPHPPALLQGRDDSRTAAPNRPALRVAPEHPRRSSTPSEAGVVVAVARPPPGIAVGCRVRFGDRRRRRPRECRGAPAEVVADRLRVDLDVRAVLVIGRPVAYPQTARHDDALPLLHRRVHVRRELAERRDRVPVGLAVDPLLLGAVVTPLGRCEPERRHGEPRAGDDVLGGRGDQAGEADGVGHGAPRV